MWQGDITEHSPGGAPWCNAPVVPVVQCPRWCGRGNSLLVTPNTQLNPIFPPAHEVTCAEPSIYLRRLITLSRVGDFFHSQYFK